MQDENSKNEETGIPSDDKRTSPDRAPQPDKGPPPESQKTDAPPSTVQDEDSRKRDILKKIDLEYHQKRDEATAREKVDKSQISDLLNKKQHPFVLPLSEIDLRDVYETFVVPDGFPDVGKCFSQNIFIIEGYEDSGKYAAARYMAYQLLQNGFVENIYHIASDVGMSLRALVKRYPKSLLIMRDAFSTESAFLFRSMRGVGGEKIGTPGERGRVLEVLSQRFNIEELRDLCLWLGVDYENLGGQSKRAKARSLIEHLERHTRVTELISRVKKTRRDIDCGNAYKFVKMLQSDLQASSSLLIFTVHNNNVSFEQKKRMQQILNLFSAEDVPRHQYTPPDLYQIFVRHLQAQLGKTDAESWLTQHGPMVMEALQKWRHPDQAVNMARRALSPDIERPEQVRGKLKEVSANPDIDVEVERFFKSLDDERKLLALNLSLLSSWPESDFWHIHDQLTPDFIEASTKTKEKTEDKEEKKEEKEKESIFGTPKTELLRDIRAHTTMIPVQIDGKKHSISHVKFEKEEYPQRIQNYVKRNHPDFLENFITHLVALAVEARDNRAVRIAATEGIGLLSRVRWSYVENTLREWANHRASYVRAMAGHVLSRAYTDPETCIYTTRLLRQWAESDVPEWQWTAASTYKEMRWIDLDFGLDSLERMACHIDLSPLNILLPFESHLIMLDEEQFEEYILHQAGVSLRRTSPVAMMMQVEKYLAEVKENEAAWEKIEPVFDAIAFAVVVIALDDYLKDAIYLLCDWINEAEAPDETTIQLAGSLIWLHLNDVIAELTEGEGSDNSILELISQDKEALDAVAEALSGSLVQLFPMQLANHRKSFEICLLIEQWANTTKYIGTMRKLLRRMKGYLIAHPKVYRYFKRFLRKRWQSRRMPKNVNKLARVITK